MANLDILCFNSFNLKNKIMKIEHKKIFRGPSKILKNISWPINICLKYFMGSMPSDNAKGLILFAKHLFDQKKIRKYFNNDNKCEFPQNH